LLYFAYIHFCMKKKFRCLFIFASINLVVISIKAAPPLYKFFAANNKMIQYTGRIDFSNPLLPRFWSSGVYIKMRFKGTGAEIVVNDQMMYGNSHNYIDITIDDQKPYRVQTTDVTDNFKIGGNLEDKVHTVTICKDTEAGIGYLEFVGIKCEKLIEPAPRPKRKMEFIGTSITAGADMDRSLYPCYFGEWYGHHNANMSYGGVTARALNADFTITAISGIGLTNSCCGIPTMPGAFDKINTRTDSLQWNFSTYQPDVVSICLGESDGAMAMDSTKFCGDYVDFIHVIRRYYPKSTIVCLNIPTGDIKLNGILKRYMTGISEYMTTHGDPKVYPFSVSKVYTSGCNNHPDMGDHELIAAELTDYIRGIMKWK
jgi:hypothetical protein